MIDTVPATPKVFGAILMEYIPEAVLEPNKMSAVLAYELGTVLASIHNHRFASYEDCIDKQGSKDLSTYFWSKFCQELEECKEHLSEKLQNACKRYFASQLYLLTSVDGPCLIHGDFRPANIIIKQEKLTGLIDWASCRVSFAEEDLCSFVNQNWLQEYKNVFFSAYASIRSVPDYARVFPFLGLKKAIAIIGFTVKNNIWKTRAEDLYQSNRQFIISFFEENKKEL